MAKRLKRDNVHVVGKKCVRNDDGKLTLTVDKLKGQKSHYQKLLNVEFPRNATNMSEKAPVEGTAIKISLKMLQSPR